MSSKIDEMEEEIVEIEKRGERIYDMCFDIIEEFGSADYAKWEERITWFVKAFIPFADNVVTVFRTEHDGKELKIKKSYSVPVIKVYYGNKCVFSGWKHDAVVGSDMDLDKVIICEWTEEINEWACRARRQRRNKRNEEKRKRLIEKKKKFHRKCDREVSEDGN